MPGPERRACRTVTGSPLPLQARRAFRQTVQAAVAIQAAFRGFQARKFSRDIKKHRAALLIQTNWRRHRAEVSFQRYRRGAIALQCAWRCKLARRELRKRRTQSRESGKLLQDKQALEGKLREVQNILQTVQTQRNELRQQYKVRCRLHPGTQTQCCAFALSNGWPSSPLCPWLQEEKGQREAAESRVAELQQGTAARIAELEAAKAAALAAAVAARAAAEATVSELRAELASVSESAASAQAALAQEMGQLKSRAAGLEAQRADIQVWRGGVMIG